MPLSWHKLPSFLEHLVSLLCLFFFSRRVHTGQQKLPIFFGTKAREIYIALRPSTFHTSWDLHCLSRILVLFFSSTSPLLRTSCMLFAHPGILSPLTFLHVYSSSLPPSSASPSLYLWVLSQHPIISLWKQLSHFNLFVQYLVLH